MSCHSSAQKPLVPSLLEKKKKKSNKQQEQQKTPQNNNQNKGNVPQGPWISGNHYLPDLTFCYSPRHFLYSSPTD